MPQIIVSKVTKFGDVSLTRPAKICKQGSNTSDNLDGEKSPLYFIDSLKLVTINPGIRKIPRLDKNKGEEQAGAELCQAQVKLG